MCAFRFILSRVSKVFSKIFNVDLVVFLTYICQCTFRIPTFTHRGFVELDREKRLWERYECNGTSRLSGIAVAARRGSRFIPVIRRLSRGLYLSQLLGSGINSSSIRLDTRRRRRRRRRRRYHLRIPSNMSRKKKIPIGKTPIGDPFVGYQRSPLSRSCPVFARITESQNPMSYQSTHWRVFYLLSLHVIYRAIYVLSASQISAYPVESFSSFSWIFCSRLLGLRN